MSRWWILLLVPSVTGALGYQYANAQQRVFESSATLLVQQRRSELSPGISDLTLSDQLAVTYATLVKSLPFLESVAENGELPVAAAGLKGMISTSIGNRPPMFTIRVRSSEPTLAQVVANTLATEFIGYVIEQRLIEIANFQAAMATQGFQNSQTQAAVQFGLLDSLTVLEPAGLPVRPIFPRTRETVIVAIVFGIALASGIVLLLSSLRDTIGSLEVLSRRFGLTPLGSIFKWSSQDIDQNELVVLKSPSSGFSEAFRQLRANVQFATASEPGKTILVTSPGPHEGKTTIMCNLAVSLAQTGKRVIVVDCDLRRPAVHRRFKSQVKGPGVSSFLAQPNIALRDVLLTTSAKGVSVVPGGPIPPNPSELLGSPRMTVLLEQTANAADLILVDSPPVLVVADAAVIAAQVSAIIIVGDGLKTKTSSLKAALDTLSRSKARILGVVVNKLKRGRFGYAYGYGSQDNYYNYYGSADEADTMSNGAGPAHRRPLMWARSALSKFLPPKDRN